MSSGKGDQEKVTALLRVIFECNYRMAIAVRDPEPSEDKASEMLRDSGSEAADICTAAINDLGEILHESFGIEEYDYNETTFKPLWKKYRAEQCPQAS